MKKITKISPVGLKGNQINERMKELMGISSINENKSSIVIELTKVGPDGNAYAIVRENHEWYIKATTKKTNLVAEDFKYIGGLVNKKSEAYPSYAKAIKHLNLKFKSLAEAHNFTGEINVFKNDNLLAEGGIAGFSEMTGNGFSGEGNLEENKPMMEEEEVELSETDAAIDKMMEESDVNNEVSDKADNKEGSIKESKLTIIRALEHMDAIIDSLTEGKVKKKVYHLR